MNRLKALHWQVIRCNWKEPRIWKSHWKNEKQRKTADSAEVTELHPPQAKIQVWNYCRLLNRYGLLCVSDQQSDLTKSFCVCLNYSTTFPLGFNLVDFCVLFWTVSFSWLQLLQRFSRCCCDFFFASSSSFWEFEMCVCFFVWFWLILGTLLLN